LNKLKPPIHWILSIAIAALGWQFCVSAQVEHKSTNKHRPLSATASCYEESTGRLIGSKRSSTSVLVSPDRRYRAYAESEAVASKPIDSSIAECQNTSTLFVSGPNSGRFRAVLVVKPSPETLGNSLDPIDWSPNGHRLLLTQGSWQWGSDAGGTMVRIYDAESEGLSREFFVEKAFGKYVGKNCAGVFQPLGFSAKGEVAVTAAPFFEVGEDKPVKESCVQQEGAWLMDTAIGTVRQLPKGYKVQHYGKTNAED
jgi:hypothetical protein